MLKKKKSASPFDVCVLCEDFHVDVEWNRLGQWKVVLCMLHSLSHSPSSFQAV